MFLSCIIFCFRIYLIRPFITLHSERSCLSCTYNEPCGNISWKKSPYIFSDTIYENHCLGEVFSIEEIQNAINKAGLSDFLKAQPQGLQTILLENGKNLSGGQAQRIALARALLRRCQYLIADEATASLDVKTTHDILGSYMQKFDCIYYIEHGEIKEQGTFQELMKQKAEFYHAYTLSSNS